MSCPPGRYPTRGEGLFRGLTLASCPGCGLVSAQPLPTQTLATDRRLIRAGC